MIIHVKQTDNLTIPKQGTPQSAGSIGSAGYDVVALEDPKIVGVETDNLLYWKSIDYIEYKTGLFIAPQTDNYGHNYHTLIFPRSSVSKYNLILANCIGLIDNDYRGEILLRFKYIWQPEDFVAIINPNMELTNGGSIEKISDTTSKLKLDIVGKVNVNKIYKKGDKIGQLVSEVTNQIDWIVAADLSATIRGSGGFGSTTNKEDKKVEAPPAASSLINKWKEAGADVAMPEKYESAAKEREKVVATISQPISQKYEKIAKEREKNLK